MKWVLRFCAGCAARRGCDSVVSPFPPPWELFILNLLTWPGSTSLQFFERWLCISESGSLVLAVVFTASSLGQVGLGAVPAWGMDTSESEKSPKFL